jgi:tetratricopeptide (TPR) repeat protein
VSQVENIGIANVGYGAKGANYLNDRAWPIFLYSNSRKELLKALSWSEISIRLDSTYYNAPANMDTRANLLYKLGRKEEAIALEVKAILLDPNNKDIQINFNKMRNGTRTWIVPTTGM